MPCTYGDMVTRPPCSFQTSPSSTRVSPGRHGGCRRNAFGGDAMRRNEFLSLSPQPSEHMIEVMSTYAIKHAES